jgi:hypothetical protein
MFPDCVDVSLDLETADNSRGCTITVKLEPVDAHEAGLTAVRNAADDIRRIDTSPTSKAAEIVQGIDLVVDNYPSTFLNSLLGVISKLDLFVTLVDKVAKVTVESIQFEGSFMLTQCPDRYIHTPILLGKLFRPCTRFIIFNSGPFAS